MPSSRTRLAAVATGTLLSLAAAPAAHAATVPLGSGATAIRFDAGVAKALTSLKVGLSAVKPAEVVNRSVALPVTGGSIDPTSGAGVIKHRGGLRLSLGSTKVSLTNFDIRVSSKPTVSVQVNGGKRLTAFSLDLSKVKTARSGIGTKLTRVGLQLTPAGARALNRSFRVKAFQAQGRLGSVAIIAVPSQAVFTGGNTALALDPGAVSALSSLGVEPGLEGGFVRADGAYSFPITEGKLDARTLIGTVQHGGTLTLTTDGVSVRLSDFVIDTKARTLSASVNGSAQTAILDLDLRKPDLEVRNQRVFLSQIAATLTQGAADALNQAFGTTAFAAGFKLGTASVLGQTL